MGRMPRLVKRGKKDRRLGEPREVSWEEIEALELDPRVELIRQLIPLGLAEVGRMLEEEVEQLAGQRLDLPRFRGRVSDEVFKLSLSPGRGKLPPRSGGVEHSDARDRRLYVRIRNRLTRIRPATPLSERLDARS